MVRKIIFSLLVVSIAACSPKKFWGESAENAKVVTPKSSPACASADKYLLGTEEESIDSLTCLNAQVNDAFTKIIGKNKNELTEKEIHILLEKGVVDAGVSSEKAKQKVTAIKKLLGIHSGPVSRARIEKVIDWMKNNRVGSRRIYQKFFAGSTEPSYTSYGQMQFTAGLLASLLRELDWNMNREELARHLGVLFLGENPSNPAPEMIDVVFDSLGILCPGLANSQSWNSKILASCSERLSNELAVGKEWIEFVVNQDSSKHDPVLVRQSMHRLVKVVDRWIDNEDLDGIRPVYWIALANKLEANPPENFEQSLDIIKHYEPKSNGSFIHPVFLKKVFHSVMYYHEFLFEGMGEYTRAFEDKKCLNAWARNWKECEIKVTPEMRKKYKSFAIISQVKNTNYALSSPLNGSLFKKILFYHAVSREIIKAFDDDDKGVVVSKAHITSDEVMKLLETTVTTVDILGRFFGNASAKIQGQRIPEQKPFASFDHLDLRGMARLVVMIGGDILPIRSYRERGFIKGLAANVLNLFPAGSVTMDQISLTSIFNMLDSFSRLREAYLGGGNTPFPTMSVVPFKYDKEKDETFIRRDDLVERLPEILRQEFPRTYESCMEFGFERSCGIFLAEILPKMGEDGSEWISASNLDLITLTASGIESLVDSCDKNSDSRLSWNLFDGKDELDCAFSSASDITRRLMESKIIKMDGLGKDIANFVMRIIDSNFLTRPFGKVALMEGTKRHVLLAPLLMLKYRSASIGSIYAFAAEMADGDGVKKYEERIREASRNSNRDTSREIFKQE